MCMRDSNGRPRRPKPSTRSMIDGMDYDRCIRSSPLLATSEKRVVARMKWGNASEKGRSRRFLRHYARADKSRFCNFMHLRHPTKSLVSSLNASQRLSRRKAAASGQETVGEEMGWTPSAARANGGGGGSWRDGGDVGWKPTRQ